MPDPERSFSWSAISSFEWNREEWWLKYVLHQKCTYESAEKGTIAFCVVAGFADPHCPVVKKTIELAFGSMVDKRIETDKKYIPKLVRYPIMQHKMRCEFHGIPLVGIADTYREPAPMTVRKFGHKPALRDYKTGRKKWDQKRANETGQLKMYALMLWILWKIRPEDCEFWIDWLPTHIVDGGIAFIETDHKKLMPRSFKVKLTMTEVLKFGQHVVDTYNEMQQYAMNRPILDTSDPSEW